MAYAFALSRIEPENSVAKILEAFSTVPDKPLVYVGNWDNSQFGQRLRRQYSGFANIHMAEPIYDLAKLRKLREGADLYIHGHSAGGTNPALVEMMHFGVPVLAHGCSFNRHSTEDKARYFESAAELAEQLRNLDPEDAGQIGTDMREIAQRKYTWDQIGKAYFELLYSA